MTASETWLNNVRADRLLGGLLLAGVLVGCGSSDTSAPKAAAPPIEAEPAKKSDPAEAIKPPSKPQDIGLTRLPTPDEVIKATKIGRDDPFAAAGSLATASGPVRLNLPDAFSFTGVIRTGGASKAIVRYGGIAGALGVGEQGGRNTDLLPSGWSVAGINVDRGQLTLRQGKQTVTAEL